jgi:DNA-binding MarR family transcriptional regulator
MARQYGHEKVSLQGCLGLLVARQPLRYGAFVDGIQAEFGVSERVCKDSVAVLADAGYVQKHRDPRDARVRLYTVSARGEAVLAHKSAATILRFARKMLSTCLSPHADVLRRAHCVRLECSEPIEALRRVETLFLSGSYPGLVRARLNNGGTPTILSGSRSR